MTCSGADREREAGRKEAKTPFVAYPDRQGSWVLEDCQSLSPEENPECTKPSQSVDDLLILPNGPQAKDDSSEVTREEACFYSISVCRGGEEASGPRGAWWDGGCRCPGAI